ncbi:hypothetical protein [Hydrogenophaga sp.]|uniref:hypothetical protein n=1 Tax=Hydrogenophaga sp. TaxID=1904254 RepID=UPI003AF9EE24
MKFNMLSRPLVSLSALAFCCGVSAQDFTLKAGESTDLNPVYWVRNCQSLLKSFIGVDVLEGPPNTELTIREESVLPTRQGCPNRVPGGMVVLKLKPDAAKFEGPIKYRVRYNTEEGEKQSSHSRTINIVPN